MQKIILPLALLGLFGCDQTKAPSAESHQTDSSTAVAQQTVDTADTYVPLATQLTKASKKYTFKEKEVFDRCTSIEMFDRASGKKVDLAKGVIAELDCIGASFEFFDDRYIVYTEDKNVKVYDVDTKQSALLFSNFEGIQTNLTDISSDGTKLLFVNVFYDETMRKKTDYTQNTRIVLVDFDKKNMKVVSKKKFDRLVMWFNAEGNMVSKEDCQFVNDHAFKYRDYDADADGLPNQDAKKMTEVSF
jgi:WD40 repeat protein